MLHNLRTTSFYTETSFMVLALINGYRHGYAWQQGLLTECTDLRYFMALALTQLWKKKLHLYEKKLHI